MKEYAEFEHLKLGGKFKALVEFEVVDTGSGWIIVSPYIGEDSHEFEISIGDYDYMMSNTHPMARKRKLEERKHQIEINRKKQEEELNQLEEELKLIEGI